MTGRALTPHRFTGLVSAGRVIALRHEQEMADAVGDVIRLAIIRSAKRFRSQALAFIASQPFEAIQGPTSPQGSDTGPRFAAMQADQILDSQRLQADLTRALTTIRHRVFRDAASGVEAHLGLSFDVTNPLLDRVLEQQGALQVAQISDTVRGELQTRLEDARSQGLNVTQAAASLAAAGPEIGLGRGAVIARTEITRVANGGSLALAKITGAASYKQWMTAPGAKYPRHEEDDGLDGQTVPLDGMFDVNGSQAEYPGDPQLPPEESGECRCSIGYTDSAG